MLFSDHGPDISFDTHDPLSADLDQRTSNLIAVLAPGKPDLLPDDLTVVNIFPIVLNAYLGTDLADPAEHVLGLANRLVDSRLGRARSPDVEGQVAR